MQRRKLCAHVRGRHVWAASQHVRVCIHGASRRHSPSVAVCARMYTRGTAGQRHCMCAWLHGHTTHIVRTNQGTVRCVQQHACGASR
eukprot:364667-Chlamydomonas_euryale.AAC.6